jgi:hypothetical protein
MQKKNFFFIFFLRTWLQAHNLQSLKLNADEIAQKSRFVPGPFTILELAPFSDLAG